MTTQNITSNSPLERPELELFPEGFLAIHNGLFEHLQQGRMTPSMLAVYVVLLQQTDWSSGRWNGNSHRLYAAFGGHLSLSQLRKILARLEKSGYIKKFNKQGVKGNYFILIDKYRVRLGEVRGLVLSASKSTTWDAPVYEPRSEQEVIGKSGAPDVRLTRVSQGSERDVIGKSQGSDVRPYQEVQESQDVQDGRREKEFNSSRTTTSPIAGAGDDDDPSENTSFPKPSAIANQTPIEVALTDKEAFLVKQELAWSNEHVNENEIPFRATKAHLDESYEAYLKYGDRYFDSVQHWLEFRASDDLQLGEDYKNDRTIRKNWTLKAFLDHGLLIGLEMTKSNSLGSYTSDNLHTHVPEHQIKDGLEWIESDLKKHHIVMDESGRTRVRQRLAEGAAHYELLNEILEEMKKRKAVNPSTPAMVAA